MQKKELLDEVGEPGLGADELRGSVALDRLGGARDGVEGSVCDDGGGRGVVRGVEEQRGGVGLVELERVVARRARGRGDGRLDAAVVLDVAVVEERAALVPGDGVGDVLGGVADSGERGTLGAVLDAAGAVVELGGGDGAAALGDAEARE